MFPALRGSVLGGLGQLLALLPVCARLAWVLELPLMRAQRISAHVCAPLRLHTRLLA
jgi:hypothetical protein